MKITELLQKESIELAGTPVSKEDALNQMVALMEKSGNLSDVEAFRREVFDREKECTTGIGRGIAIPHGKCSAVQRPGLAAMVIPDGVDFRSLDGKPTNLIFLIAAPDTKENIHVDVLSKLSMLLTNRDFPEKLRKAESVEEFLMVVDEEDQAVGGVEEQLAVTCSEKAQKEKAPEIPEIKEENQRKTVLAVTSCPAGIAHTYIAAMELEKAARKKGCNFKVETRGSSGTKNALTEEEIHKADAIIVAADAAVPMGRFEGKPLICCRAGEGISGADRLIERALSGEVPVYMHGRYKERTDLSSVEYLGHQLYMQLMNGISHMLPFVVGGGILLALAFLIDSLCLPVDTLTAAERSAFGSITPVASVLRKTANTAFGFMLPVMAGFISMAIADRPGLAVGFVGGMIAAGGKSGFLGALVAGFVAGNLMEQIKKLCSRLPEQLERISPVLLCPVLGMLTIGFLMIGITEPLIGVLNERLNMALVGLSGSSKIVIGVVVASMMAIDMGGPFNKAAYVFGTASIAAGNYEIMAAVMIGGMVPPCATALSTMLFPKKYPKEARKTAPANFIMGLAFITEGAIPFAAADPLRVIPCCMAASGLAGGLSMAFDCTLMAPHGGIFVFPLVGHSLLYLVALIAGTVAGAVFLGLLKKNAEEQ